MFMGMPFVFWAALVAAIVILVILWPDRKWNGHRGDVASHRNGMAQMDKVHRTSRKGS